MLPCYAGVAGAAVGPRIAGVARAVGGGRAALGRARARWTVTAGGISCCRLILACLARPARLAIEPRIAGVARAVGTSIAASGRARVCWAACAHATRHCRLLRRVCAARTIGAAPRTYLGLVLPCYAGVAGAAVGPRIAGVARAVGGGRAALGRARARWTVRAGSISCCLLILASRTPLARACGATHNAAQFYD